MRLIDADALKEKLEAWKKEAERRDANINYAFAFAIIAQVNAEPTIEERKRGEWIEYDSDEDKYDIIKCSCCNHTFTVDSFHWTDIGFTKDDFNFCPNCGADMREVNRMDDLISRQAAIDLIKNDAFWVQYAWGGRGHKPEMEMVDDLVESIIKQMKESVTSRLKQMPSAQPEHTVTHSCDSERTETHDLVSRRAALEAMDTWDKFGCDPDGKLVRYDDDKHYVPYVRYEDMVYAVKNLPSVQPQRWIPVSERLPENIRPVIVTWKNTDPKSYYQYIVGKHFTGTACYKNGKWYWYSSTTEDMLAEYGRYDSEEFDEAIECVAWMPIPEPYAERRQDG